MKKERNIKKYYVPILYIIIYPFLLCVMVLFRIQIKKNKIKVQKGSLIIANHQSKIDAFLIMYAFGIQNMMTLMPCVYPVTHVYMNKKIIGRTLSLFGAYRMGESSIEKAKALLYTGEMLRKGYTVLLFPEGAISRHKSDSVDLSLFKKECIHS